MNGDEDFEDENVSAPVEREHYNPVLARLQGRSKTGPAYKRSRVQEKETKERLKGGRAIPASGAKFRKADVEVPDLARIECKATQAKSFSVTREMVRKVEDAALLSNQIPYIEIEFVNVSGKVQDSCVVMTRAALEALLNRVADATGITPTDRRSVKLAQRHDRRLTTKQLKR